MTNTQNAAAQVTRQIDDGLPNQLHEVSSRRPIRSVDCNGPFYPPGGELPNYAFDWGHGRKFSVFDGKKHLHFADILDAIQQLSPCRLVGETSFCSFDSRKRNEAIDLAEKLGSELRVTSNRAVKNYRLDHKLPAKASLKLKGLESDDEDARILWQIAFVNKHHLGKPYRWEVRPDTWKTKIVKERSIEWVGPDAERARSLLPPAADAPDYLAGWQEEGKLTPPRNKEGKREKLWREHMVLPMVLAAIDVVEKGKGLREFNRYVGAYSRRKGSVLSSNFYFHRIPAICANDNTKENRNKESTKLRRGTRWIFSEVKKRLLSGLPNQSTQ